MRFAVVLVGISEIYESAWACVARSSVLLGHQRGRLKGPRCLCVLAA